MQKIYGDVCLLKLSKSLSANCWVESLVYVYMLPIYTLQVLIVIEHLKYYNNVFHSMFKINTVMCVT